MGIDGNGRKMVVRGFEKNAINFKIPVRSMPDERIFFEKFLLFSLNHIINHNDKRLLELRFGVML